jgi:hypothetical protein
MACETPSLETYLLVTIVDYEMEVNEYQPEDRYGTARLTGRDTLDHQGRDEGVLTDHRILVLCVPTRVVVVSYAQNIRFSVSHPL